VALVGSGVRHRGSHGRLERRKEVHDRGIHELGGPLSVNRTLAEEALRLGPGKIINKLLVVVTPVRY
jgi:hypothetical protein